MVEAVMVRIMRHRRTKGAETDRPNLKPQIPSLYSTLFTTRSASDIVVPVRNRKGEIVAVLDVDSDKTDRFDEIDASALEKISKMIF